jgi:hypothetical protein
MGLDPNGPTCGDVDVRQLSAHDARGIDPVQPGMLMSISTTSGS